MGILVGLDIGIASVGWAVVKDDYTVLEAGSNLFDSADASGNADRRSMRQMRRLLRRRKTRIRDFNKLWEQSGKVVPFSQINHQLMLRVKGLSEKLSEDEIYFVLANMLRHRGISYLEDALDESTIGKSDYEKGLQKNQEELKDRLPCEIQWDRLQKYGTYRGRTDIKTQDGEDLILSNVFTVGAYRREIEKFFHTQSSYHSFLDDCFLEEYLSIFNRKREYYEGPGNELSRTDYGRYTCRKDKETGKYITEDNIFEKLIGKCSVYPEEMRAAGASYTAQEFNLLNDLNNLTVNGRKLSKEEKRLIVDQILSTERADIKKIIKKVIGEDILMFTGARIDKDGKEILHKFETYSKLRRALTQIDKDIKEFTRYELDEIGKILTLNPDRDAIVKAVRKDPDHLFHCQEDEVIECLSRFRKKNPSLFSRWQSLSLKVMNEMMPELYETDKNQMQILTQWGIFQNSVEKFKNYTKIPKDEILEEIYNPVVRRSVRIAIDIVNAIVKKYGYPDQIIIEMPRDRNSDEEKKRINDLQKKNKNELENITAKIKSEYGITITDGTYSRHNNLRLKLRLWNEQNGICLYSGRPIKIDDLLRDQNLFEVDHIIPRSISFDDSRSNKVLVYSTENQKKKNMTPYMYLSAQSREWGYPQFRSQVEDLYKKKRISRGKRDKLLFTDDITKIDVMKGFINRNLNDTRYASRLILNTFQDYFQAKDASTKIKVIRGSFTHQMRVGLKLSKDREESFAHHAVDAMLICYSQMGYEAYRKVKENFIDFETGEILDESKWDEEMNDATYEEFLYQNKILKIKKGIAEGEKKIKYWHKADRKPNRMISKQTIRGTRELDGKVQKINKLDLYTQNGFNTFKNLIKKRQEDRILMARHDPKSFEMLMQVYYDYEDAKNPFVEYQRETGDYVRRYAKKHDGPKIRTLKYTDGEVNSCIDVSHKYGFEQGSRKVILESLNPYRMDVYYRESDGTYHLVGLKYADFKYIKGRYCIDQNAYTKALIAEKILKKGQEWRDLGELGYQFKLSFYKNEIICYEKNGEIFEERFLSRTMPQQKNYIETKPVNAKDFPKRHLVGLTKSASIVKIRTDILGNKYYCAKEKFSL